MTKREIVANITVELDLPKVQVKQIVQRTLDTITETLVTEGRIELRDFGVSSWPSSARQSILTEKVGKPP